MNAALRFPGWEVNRHKTECWRGHAFDDANTYKQGRSRKCRRCGAIRARHAYRSRGGANSRQGMPPARAGRHRR